MTDTDIETMGKKILQIKKLGKKYGKFTTLDDISYKYKKEINIIID